MSTIKLGNPAVVGLAAFGLSALLLQFHNLGWCGLGPVVSIGLVFGGLAQLIAGFMEQKTGNNFGFGARTGAFRNNFGFAAFTSYGSFWIGLGLIWILNHFEIYQSSGTDVGFYLIGWTLLTIIFCIASFFIHTAMAFTFSTLVVGFVLLDLAHFGFPELITAAAYVLIITALSAWYMMAAIIINDVAGKNLLKVGKPWIKVS